MVVDDLARNRDALIASAQRRARRAAADHRDGHAVDVVADAGIAVEHLAKALLMLELPVLVLEARSDPSLAAIRWACGRGPMPSGLKTVAGFEAWRRATGLLPELESISGKDMKSLLDGRSASVHMAALSEAGLDPLALLGDATAILLPALGRDMAQFWGPWANSVSARRDHRSTALLIAVTERRDAAAHSFARLLEEQPAVVELMRRQLRNFEWDETPMACPVCRSVGVAAGDLEPDIDAEVDVEDGCTYYTGSYVAAWDFHARTFRCGVCPFVLDRPEEFRALGLPRMWRIERDPGPPPDGDPDDWVDPPDPD